MSQRELRAKMILPAGRDTTYPIRCYANNATSYRDITSKTIRLRYRSPLARDTILGTWEQATHDDATNGLTHIDILAAEVPTVGTYEYVLDEAPYTAGSVFEIGDFVIIKY